MKKWNWKLIGISLAILAVVVMVSMLIFPQWKTQFGIGGAILGIIVVAAPKIIDFLDKAKKLFIKDAEKETAASAPIGGDSVGGNKETKSGDNSVTVGGNNTGTIINQPTHIGQ